MCKSIETCAGCGTRRIPRARTCPNPSSPTGPPRPSRALFRRAVCDPQVKTPTTRGLSRERWKHTFDGACNPGRPVDTLVTGRHGHQRRGPGHLRRGCGNTHYWHGEEGARISGARAQEGLAPPRREYWTACSVRPRLRRAGINANRSGSPRWSSCSANGPRPVRRHGPGQHNSFEVLLTRRAIRDGRWQCFDQRT